MSLLTVLSEYPLLEGDDARKAVWLADVPLAASHRLRGTLNDGKASNSVTAALSQFDPSIVAATLKLYLLELPDSLVSASLYDVIKTIYSSPSTSEASSAAPRISVLQNTLSQLRLANIATLDAISTHLVRFLDLTSADDTYMNELVTTLAPCVLRPRAETSLTFTEKYSVRFLHDLLNHKNAIFDELKRAAHSATHGYTHSSSLNYSASVARANSTVVTPRRERAPSTDESNRRVHMEERARAIAAAGAPHSRASSPATPARDGLLDQRRQRDSSRGPSETRFPVAVSTSTSRSTGTLASSVAMASSVQGTPTRQSLEVPGVMDNSPVAGRWTGHASTATTTTPTPTPSAVQQPYGQGQPLPYTSQTQTTAPLPTTTYPHSQPQAYSSLPPASAEGTPTASYASVGRAEAALPALPGGEVEKRNSLGRTSMATSRLARKPGSAAGSVSSMHRYVAVSMRNEEADGTERRPVGVELTDKPMDDD